LVWVGWSSRATRPAVSMTCLVAAAMVAWPLAVLAAPPRTGSLPFPGPHHLINVLPPFLLGMGALAAARNRVVRLPAIAMTGIIVAAQLVVAPPFFATIDEYSPEADYGVPWHYTGQMVDFLRDRAAPSGTPVYVGGAGSNLTLFGEAEQQNLIEWLLRRDYDLSRANDSRDGLVFRVDKDRLLFATTNDRHSETRFLQKEFPASQLLEQHLAGSDWIRRVFELSPSDLLAWTSTHLAPISDPAANGRFLHYERMALIPPAAPGLPTTLAVLWGFQSDPIEAFFTDIVLISNGKEIFREPHLAYPAPFLEPRDWESLRVLNLFDLPASVDVNQVTEVMLVHNGLRSGRDIAPSIRFAVPSSASVAQVEAAGSQG
jgi:hypothetical protein